MGFGVQAAATCTCGGGGLWRSDRIISLTHPPLPSPHPKKPRHHLPGHHAAAGGQLHAAGVHHGEARPPRLGHRCVLHVLCLLIGWVDGPRPEGGDGWT